MRVDYNVLTNRVKKKRKAGNKGCRTKGCILPGCTLEQFLFNVKRPICCTL